MWVQAAVLIAVGVFGIIGIAAATYRFLEEQQRLNQYHRESLPEQPLEPRIVVLGPCGICRGDVNNVTGFRSPCNHYMHYTCTVAITRPSQGHSPAFNWTDVCRFCVISRINNDASLRPGRNEGLRDRGPNRQICAHCRRNFLDNDTKRHMACDRHQVHTTCWDTMNASGFTTCPMCMDEMS